MDYRKYLKEGFQLKEFSIRANGKDVGPIWASYDARCRELENKVKQGETLSDEDKEYIKKAIKLGNDYFNALNTCFSRDAKNGSQIERECAGLVDGKESIKDRINIYAKLIGDKVDNTTNDQNAENAAENSEATQEQMSDDDKVAILKDALKKDPDLLNQYNSLKSTYNALMRNNVTGTGADGVNNITEEQASAKALIIDEFSRLNKELNLQLSSVEEFDDLIAKVEIAEDWEAANNDEEANAESTGTEVAESDELDKIREDKENAFREYYIHKLKALEINKLYSNAIQSRNSEEIARISMQKEALVTEEASILNTYRAVINTDIENIKNEQQLKGIVSEESLELIKDNEALKQELESYYTDPKYAELKSEIEQSLKDEEALNNLVNGDPSQVMALANTFKANFKTEQDIDVWRDCIYKYAKLLVAYNALVKEATNVGLLPSDMEKLQKYIRIASTIVTIASFIPGVQAVGLPLQMAAHSLRMAGGITTAALNAKKAVKEFQDGNPKAGMVRIIGAGFGALAAYSGFKSLRVDINNLQTFNMFTPDNLSKINFEQERAAIDNQIANIDQTDSVNSIKTLDALNAKKSLLDTQENALNVYKSNPELYNRQLNDLWHNKTTSGELQNVINSTSKAFKEEAELAAQAVQQDIIEAHTDELMEKIPTLEDLKNMPEAEAREMANKWAADGGWYANVMAHGTADDQAKAIYALRVINNSADGKAQIEAYNAIAKASEGITRANKMMGDIHSQQGELFADVCKNIKGSVYDKVDNIVDDATSRKIVSGLYDLGTTNGADSKFTVGAVQKLITDSGVTDQATQQQLLKNIFSKYKTTMTADTILSPKDANLFTRISDVNLGTLQAGKNIPVDFANRAQDLSSGMSQWGTVAANNAENYNIARAKAGF